MAIVDDTARRALLRRGFALEYATLCWNVAGVVVLAIAGYAFAALAGYLLAQSTVVLAAGYHRRHSVLGIARTAVTAAAMLARRREPRAGRALDNPCWRLRAGSP